MKFATLPLAGAYLIHLEKREDDRGFFARAFCENEFSAHGLSSRFALSKSFLKEVIFSSATVKCFTKEMVESAATVSKQVWNLPDQGNPPGNSAAP